MARIVDKHKVNIPAAVEGADGSSLRLLGSVGEPINPEAWDWYYKNIGKSRCPIVDTWWQTETGGNMMSTLPGAHALKPGSAARPFFGVVAALIDNQHHRRQPGESRFVAVPGAHVVWRP